ncbi:MAG: hypothetical protein NUV51_11680 [Sulfuricaulis sp.]|nr:hypothetical protein [Sulfuricaulis sp.]
MKNLPNVEVMRSRDFDDDLREPTPILPGVVGSITFSPDKSNPVHDPALVIAQAEVERLRAGNRKLLDENNELKRLLKVRNK